MSSFTLMIKSEDHGGFLVQGDHQEQPTESGVVVFTSTSNNGTLTVFHPPPPGATKTIPFEPGDTISVSSDGDLLIHTQKDPSDLRCDPSEWAPAPTTYHKHAAGGQW